MQLEILNVIQADAIDRSVFGNKKDAEFVRNQRFLSCSCFLVPFDPSNV